MGLPQELAPRTHLCLYCSLSIPALLQGCAQGLALLQAVLPAADLLVQSSLLHPRAALINEKVDAAAVRNVAVVAAVSLSPSRMLHAIKCSFCLDHETCSRCTWMLI